MAETAETEAPAEDEAATAAPEGAAAPEDGDELSSEWESMVGEGEGGNSGAAHERIL
ncbi:MAG TPA: flagellar motor switch protein FliM, partial [Alphaproteobacteria bacterium]|nr:flagellar motor switch protein FliM [Alphaproteobacteria bacterium]